jgi:hypothetical protein
LEEKRTKRRGEGWRKRHKRDIRTIKFTSYTRKMTKALTLLSQAKAITKPCKNLGIGISEHPADWWIWPLQICNITNNP